MYDNPLAVSVAVVVIPQVQGSVRSRLTQKYFELAGKYIFSISSASILKRINDSVGVWEHTVTLISYTRILITIRGYRLFLRACTTVDSSHG